MSYECEWCKKTWEKRNTRDRHVARGCPKKPKDVETNFQQLLTSSSTSNSVSLIDPSLLTNPKPDPPANEENEMEDDEDSDFVPEEENPEDEKEQEEVVIVEKPAPVRKQIKPPPKRKIVIPSKKRVLGSLDVLCSDFVKLSNSLKLSIKKRAILKKVLFTVLKDKCADHHINRSTVQKMIELLRSDQDTQEIHFKLDKNTLTKDYLNFAFSMNQMKVIDDLANIEVTQEAIDQQLVFATYYAKLSKLMLQYNLASTDRSKESVRDVIEALSQMDYGSDDVVNPVTWYETLFIQPRDSLCGTIAVVSLVTIVLKWNSMFYFWIAIFAFSFSVVFYLRIVESIRRLNFL